MLKTGPLDPDQLRAPCPVSDLFGLDGRELLARLELRSLAGNVAASLALIETSAARSRREPRLKEGHAEHLYMPLMMGGPRIGWVPRSRSPPRSARSPLRLAAS